MSDRDYTDVTDEQLQREMKRVRRKIEGIESEITSRRNYLAEMQAEFDRRMRVAYLEAHPEPTD